MPSAPRSSDLLSDLPDRLVAALLTNAKTVKLAADEILFLAGDPGDGCYRLEEGLVKVSMVSPKGAERILAILGPGSIVGDMAMVDGRPRSASVSALRDCKLRFISRASFEAVATKNPEVYKHLLNLVATRLRDTGPLPAAPAGRFDCLWISAGQSSESSESSDPADSTQARRINNVRSLAS